MRPPIVCWLLLGLLVSAIPGPGGPAAATVGRGDDNFWLGMSRTQVDSAVTARRDTVISNGTGFLVCRGSDPAIEYVQYSFLTAPHGLQYLWRVIIGYRLSASTTDFINAREGLIRLLGEPETDTWKDREAAGDRDALPSETSQLVAWADAMTVVRLGARWSDAPDPSADRMLVTWTDRRLERVVVAGARNIVKRRNQQ
jgi:hypothetical protein